MSGWENPPEPLSYEGEFTIGSDDAYVAGRYFSLVSWQEKQSVNADPFEDRLLDDLFPERVTLGAHEWHTRHDGDSFGRVRVTVEFLP